jgi:3-hydroxyisobutyrate dehydrogenase
MQVGFVGLGNMGNNMAMNLVKAGHSVQVTDLRREAASNLEEAGARWVESPQAAAQGSAFTFLSLPKPKDVELVVLADNGVLAGSESGSVIVDMSTNAPTTVKDLAEKTQAKGIAFLDAPVSGGVRGARNGSLAIMVGGDKDVYDSCEPLLKVMGENVFYVGDIGAGNVAKLINNMLAFIHMMGAAEALTLGAKAGVDLNVLWEIVKASSGGSFVWNAGTRAILRDRLAPTFTVDLASKDIGLATELGDELGVPLQMGKMAQSLIENYQKTGYAQEDILATIKELEKQTGATVRGTWRDPA